MKKLLFLFLFIFSCFALFAQEVIYEKSYDYSNRTESIKLIKYNYGIYNETEYTIITVNFDKKKNTAIRCYVYCSEEPIIETLLFELEENRLNKNYSTQLEEMTKKNNPCYEFISSSIDTDNNIVFKNLVYFYID